MNKMRRPKRIKRTAWPPYAKTKPEKNAETRRKKPDQDAESQSKTPPQSRKSAQKERGKETGLVTDRQLLPRMPYGVSGRGAAGEKEEYGEII